MKPETSLLCLQESTTEPFLEPEETNPYLHVNEVTRLIIWKMNVF
jgi:hypothetical protein